MTPEEKFNQEVWWILQEIKRDEFLTPKGKRVEFRIRIHPKTSNETKRANPNAIPSDDNQRKLLYKLKEWKALDLELVDNILRGSDIFNPQIYQLVIKRLKFDKLYNLYEKSYKSEKEKERPSLKPHASSFDWEKLSPENLKIAQKVIKITLNFLQFHQINRLLLATKIPLRKFENEQVYLDDVSGVLNRTESVKVINTELHYQIKEYQRTRVRLPSSMTAYGYHDENELPDYLPSEDELKNYVFLQISSSDELHRVQGLIDKKLKINTSSTGRIQTKQESSKFILSVKDREIWVNEYLIGKPHAVGSNFEFFDYIRSQAPHTKINRNELPSKFGNLSIQEQVKNKSFIKILNGLGFKGEVLKAFFYKRGKDTLTYKGNEISKENLVEAGVKISLFLKELELAHTKNSPE